MPHPAEKLLPTSHFGPGAATHRSMSPMASGSAGPQGGQEDGGPHRSPAFHEDDRFGLTGNMTG